MVCPRRRNYASGDRVPGDRAIAAGFAFFWAEVLRRSFPSLSILLAFLYAFRLRMEIVPELELPFASPFQEATWAFLFPFHLAFSYLYQLALTFPFLPFFPSQVLGWDHFFPYQMQLCFPFERGYFFR